jgi:hypothetical protein
MHYTVRIFEFMKTNRATMDPDIIKRANEKLQDDLEVAKKMNQLYNTGTRYWHNLVEGYTSTLNYDADTHHFISIAFSTDLAFPLKQIAPFKYKVVV